MQSQEKNALLTKGNVEKNSKYSLFRTIYFGNGILISIAFLDHFDLFCPCGTIPFKDRFCLRFLLFPVLFIRSPKMDYWNGGCHAA